MATYDVWNAFPHPLNIWIFIALVSLVVEVNAGMFFLAFGVLPSIFGIPIRGFTVLMCYVAYWAVSHFIFSS